MQLEIYQWLVPIVGIILIIRTIRSYMAGRRSAGSSVLWIVFWLTIGVLAVIPNEFSYRLTSFLGFENNVNAIIFVILGALLINVFYLSSKADHLEQRLTDLTRQIGLEKQDMLEQNPAFRSVEKSIEIKNKFQDKVSENLRKTDKPDTKNLPIE